MSIQNWLRSSALYYADSALGVNGVIDGLKGSNSDLDLEQPYFGYSPHYSKSVNRYNIGFINLVLYFLSSFWWKRKRKRRILKEKKVKLEPPKKKFAVKNGDAHGGYDGACPNCLELEPKSVRYQNKKCRKNTRALSLTGT